MPALSRNEDAAADYRAALADYKQAVSLNPALERKLRGWMQACRRALEEK